MMVVVVDGERRRLFEKLRALRGLRRRKIGGESRNSEEDDADGV